MFRAKAVILYTVGALSSLLTILPTAFAGDCPAKIAFIKNDEVSAIVVDSLKAVYSELNCATQFVALPGLRGIHTFNNHEVDGEAMRFTLAEVRYTRDFIRSPAPLVTLKSALWVNPEFAQDHRRQMGAVRGILWQRKYADGKAFLFFPNYGAMLEAYRKKEIAGFISNDILVKKRLQSGFFHTAPQLKDTLRVDTLFHYLGTEHRLFMNRFAHHVQKHGSFEHLSEAFTR